MRGGHSWAHQTVMLCTLMIQTFALVFVAEVSTFTCPLRCSPSQLGVRSNACAEAIWDNQYHMTYKQGPDAFQHKWYLCCLQTVLVFLSHPFPYASVQYT